MGDEDPNWCDLSPACNMNEVVWGPEGQNPILGNASNGSDACDVPFCPNILSYSINDSQYVVGAGYLAGWVALVRLGLVVLPLCFYSYWLSVNSLRSCPGHLPSADFTNGSFIFLASPQA